MDLSRIELRESLIKRILTDEELSEYRKKNTDRQRIEYIGGRFAAKEAIFKATHDPAWLNYSVLNDENGKPYAAGHPEIQISISHDAGIAAAVVLVII